MAKFSITGDHQSEAAMPEKELKHQRVIGQNET